MPILFQAGILSIFVDNQDPVQPLTAERGDRNHSYRPVSPLITQ